MNLNQTKDEAFLYSNSPQGDFVMGTYQRLIAECSAIFVASPYVTLTEELRHAAEEGKSVNLLVGLNPSTSAKALRMIIGIPGVSIRFYTKRFHAKIYLFDQCALLGSSNLTDGGMQKNREATVIVEDPIHLQEIAALSQELWSGAHVLTPNALDAFEKAVGPHTPNDFWTAKIESAVGTAEPPNISVQSRKHNSEYTFIQILRRKVYEQFQPAFNEVSAFLSAEGVHRSEWSQADPGSETNRFLNWVRLTYGVSDEWRKSPRRGVEERRVILKELGTEWAVTKKPRIESDYFVNLSLLRQVFESEDALIAADQNGLSNALMCIHAFEEQIRFISGGYTNIIEHFWDLNGNDFDRVKKSFRHLIFGKDEFIQRLYEVLNFPEWKIAKFGESCALELTGTVRPAMCPPMNGRSAKALRYIGFTVPA